MTPRRIFRGWVVLALLVLLVIFLTTNVLSGPKEYSKENLHFIQAKIAASQVEKATIQDSKQIIQITTKDNKKYESSYVTNQGRYLADSLNDKNVAYEVKVERSNVLVSLLLNLLPLVLVVALFLFLMNQMQGGGNRVMNFGKSKAKLVSKDTPKTTFADVAGADEALEELEEIKEFLENPGKFQAIGAKIPKGVLLYGPPGTGKTLLARAVAGEAGVPFYSISGSDFVEMFVGVGASRVRDLFEQAKANAPAIIFVDEIDAVGRHRGAGLGGGHDEREQTLNQLLVEMDGFDVKGGVILIAATNRPDILDPALLRPGRFDRQIVVDRPDLQGREAILKVHAKGKPIGADVDLLVIARRTPGFTGADLANVLNEAALLAARADQKVISSALLEESIDRVLAGPERKTRAISDREKKRIAYHEGGHALVAHALPNSDPVHKITILPRGRALGYTMQLPLEDKYLSTRSEMLDKLAVLLGGRTAEELVFREPTTGASDDIEKATQIARAMVTQYGMSDKLGALKFGAESGEVFLGREVGHQRDYSEAVAGEIDSEVRKLIEAAHDEAWEVLNTYRDELDALVLRLMDTETLSKDDVLETFATVQKRPIRGYYTGVGRRVPSDRPPVRTPAELGLVTTDVADLVHGGGNGHPGQRPRDNGGARSAGGGHDANGGNGNGSQGLTQPAGAGPVTDPGQGHHDPGSGPGASPMGGPTAPTGPAGPPGAPPPDAPRISNPWAPPVWPNDDERKHR
ncbi:MULTISPECIES: ATP-dependent zinc metalloprotease FtsH [unclassified Pseudofrankia]|uniref:ATP-dependent zinc metalloprotease FtsH n=1 Tax=unclassified Pseudofrankia TaxID=2994372 RepID=UPI0008DA6972|nr:MULTISPECIES: ATP-dependent zinc metalloprotease FtsH [unclassified Pseudofrankia]MDT3441796.1 ATP-dependent zinc metalloprotease FtsH [Pseudofrankia sp. BMG5.37]OHV47085.1 cell division protein FtsH [Pseudofrankia sp. BMG5.36]